MWKCAYEFILSSCYGFHQAVSMLDTESIQWLLRRTLCDTHWLHHWSWTGSRGLQLMFIPSGFPSDTEKRPRISRPTVENSKALSLFLTGKGFQTLHLLNQRTAPTCPSPRNLWSERQHVKREKKNPIKIHFHKLNFLEYILQRISSSFTRSKVKGIHADHVRGLTVY